MKCFQVYGSFPLLSEKKLDDLYMENNFNITWLIAFFNHNRTVPHSRDEYYESLKAYVSVSA